MTDLTFIHVSGMRDPQKISLTDENIQDAISSGLITQNKNDYYFLSSYKIENMPGDISAKHIEISNISKDKPDNINQIKTQTHTGKIFTIDYPSHEFFFNGKHLLYANNRVIEINGYSITHKENGDNFLFMANVYGILPKETTVIKRFPEVTERSINIGGYNPFSKTKEKIHQTFFGDECDAIWSHIFYKQKSNQLYLNDPGSPMIITHIDGSKIDPKEVYEDKGLEIMNV